MNKYLFSVVIALVILAGSVPAYAGSSSAIAKNAEQVSVKDYGAKGNGVADDAPAFRKVIVYLMARGGGTVVIPPGSYFLGSFDPTPISKDEFVVFNVGTGVTIRGQTMHSTSLKLSKTLQRTVPGGGRLSFIGVRAGATGVIIRDLNFDYNGILLTDAAFRSYNAVRSNGQQVLIERIRAINAPGRNVVVGANAVTLRESIFTNSNQNIPGNTLADDASFVYLNGADNLVENNVFSNDAPAKSNSGGVEVHATNSKVLRNKFTNLYPAIYDGIQNGTVAKNNQVIGNSFSNCRGGVHAIDLHRGWIIADNLFIDANLPPFFAIMTPRNDLTGVTSAGIQENVTIRNNTFETVRGDPQRPYIAVAGVQNSVIQGNTFNGDAIPLELLVSTTETKNVVISDNVFVDPPDSKFSYGQVHLSGDNGGSWGGAFTDVLVKNNRFIKKSSLGKPVNIYPLATSGSGALTFKNIRAVDNEISNLHSHVGGPSGRATIAPGRSRAP